jgi:methyl-accepting chemotaxis protein
MPRFQPFLPGVWLMRQLRLPTKLGLLAFAIVIPLLVVCVSLVLRISDEIKVLDSEVQGVHGITALSDLVALAQTHRGQTNMLLSGNASARGALEKTRAALPAALAAAGAALTSRPDFDLDKGWGSVEGRLRRLADTEKLSPEQAFEIHTSLIAELKRLMYTTAERSSLLFDPDPASYFLMDIVVSRAVPWTEQMARLRGQGAGLLSRPEGPGEGAAGLRSQLQVLARETDDFRFATVFAQRYGQDGLPAEEAIKASESFVALAQRSLDSPGSISGATFFDTGTAAITSALGYQSAVLQRLDQLLEVRKESAVLHRRVAIGAALLGLTAMAYLLTSFYLSFVIDFRHVSKVMGEIAKGNLRAHVQVRGTDELADLATQLESMIGNLSGMVAEVRSNSALVAHAGKSLASGNRELADRTEQQAANLEQTAASVQELSGTVQQNAQTAGDSDSQASRVRDIAESGSQAMGRAVESVEGIQKSAQQMHEIIGVIDSLAFQTNILALNAAVEAARAGEQGRGFAVVAAEVRSLAQRSAASAREIRELIQSSAQQVSTSVGQIRTAGASMTEIVNGVRGVAANMSLISAASAEQSGGLSEISAAVGQLDEITQRNARMVERAVQQATQLEGRAATLARAVSSFQLQQGAAEEAMQLVERALVQRAQSGRESFLHQVTEPAMQFHDRDMYVFVLDRSGAYRAFGGKPEKVGSRVQDIPGVDGVALLEAIVAQAELEPGWVEYDITNPQSGAIQTKMSYVTKVDDLYLGCGVYKSLTTQV